MIDDFYSISVEDEELEQTLRRQEKDLKSETLAMKSMRIARREYDKHHLQGSPHKDVWDADKAKVTGAEIDSSMAARSRGLNSKLVSAREQEVSPSVCDPGACVFEALFKCLAILFGGGLDLGGYVSVPLWWQFLIKSTRSVILEKLIKDDPT